MNIKKIMCTTVVSAVAVLSASLAAKALSTSHIISVCENLEALARSESDGLGPMCSQTGNAGTYYMKLCSNCSGSYGKYAMDKVAYCSD